MGSKLEITVTGTPVVDDTLVFTTTKSMRFSNVTGFGRIPISSDYQTQVNFIRNRFNTDFNGTNEFTVTVNSDGVISIVHPDEDYFIDASTSSSAITLVISAIELEPKNDVTVVVSPAPEPCANVSVRINFTVVQDTVEAIVQGQVIATEVNAREMTVEVPRGSGGVNFKYILDTKVDYTFQEVPVVLEILQLDVSNNFFGTSVAIESNISDSRYQVVYQPDPNVIPTPDPNEYNTSNTRVGLASGNYVAFVLDPFGCTTFQTFTASDVGAYIRAPFYSYVSPINDFPFFKLGTKFDGKNLNQDNRLTHEIPLKNQSKQNYYHPAWEGQEGKIQIKASAEIVEAYVIDCDGNETILPIEQKSDFIQSDNILDGNYETIDDRLWVSFTPGNIYGSSGEVIGEHNFNGTIPAYYREGTVLNVQDIGIAPIEEIITEGAITYAIINIGGADVTGSGKILSVHSVELYEIYEAYYDVTAIPTDIFSLAFKVENPDSAVAYWRTNPIKKVASEDIKEYHHVQYYSLDYNEINYSWDINHKRYVEYNRLPIPVTPNADIETYQTDTNIVKLDYSGLRNYAFSFKDMPNEIAISLVECINSSDILTIDSKPYVSQDGAEMVNRGYQVSEVTANLAAGARTDLGLPFYSPLFNSVDSFYPIVP